MAHRALENIDFKLCSERIHLIVDRSKNKKEMDIFNEYIRVNLQALLSSSTQLFINHALSHEEAGLQIADLYGKSYKNALFFLFGERAQLPAR